MTSPFLKSFAYAAQGITHSFKVGRNFKVQLSFGVLAVALGIALEIDLTQWAIIAMCIGAVLGGECFNTAIEAVVDLVSPEKNELAGIAKDCAAGAVLLFSIASVAVAAFVFLPKIIGLFAL